MKVLIVDDDQDCLNDIYDALIPLNYTLIKEISPIEALNKFKSDNFDVVITDIRMPQMNGIELLKNIKKINKEARVIIITGYGDLDTAVQAINNHAYAFFGKPINFEELVEVLRKIDDEIKLNIKIDYNKLSEEYINLKKSYNEMLDLLKSLQGDKIK
jgi:DNA-binding NtrC family response regulator